MIVIITLSRTYDIWEPGACPAMSDKPPVIKNKNKKVGNNVNFLRFNKFFHKSIYYEINK